MNKDITEKFADDAVSKLAYVKRNPLGFSSSLLWQALTLALALLDFDSRQRCGPSFAQAGDGRTVWHHAHPDCICRC